VAAGKQIRQDKRGQHLSRPVIELIEAPRWAVCRSCRRPPLFVVILLAPRLDHGRLMDEAAPNARRGTTTTTTTTHDLINAGLDRSRCGSGSIPRLRENPNRDGRYVEQIEGGESKIGALDASHVLECLRQV
jgi:hypothetical protein